MSLSKPKLEPGQSMEDGLSKHLTPEEYFKNSRPYMLGNFRIHRKAEKLLWNDKRIQLLPAKYFTNLNVLDVGCREGLLTILIACSCSSSCSETVPPINTWTGSISSQYPQSRTLGGPVRGQKEICRDDFDEHQAVTTDVPEHYRKKPEHHH